jgi:UDP-N-acetyl-D-mannosaminuronate dehydrogenase
MRIAMIGGGYVGFVSGACFAEFGSEVAMVESDPAKLKSLRSGDMPIFEPIGKSCSVNLGDFASIVTMVVACAIWPLFFTAVLNFGA